MTARSALGMLGTHGFYAAFNIQTVRPIGLVNSEHAAVEISNLMKRLHACVTLTYDGVLKLKKIIIIIYSLITRQ